ncbi:hypothetical protein, conserved [Eimeria necatrix]|uniref:tRNA/rRNA methyltransferase SpoU type domain-containing protein n=1 Tax=Eimeria necatrix TaxID=51315 RepID=U6MVG1_9EIME|nr:hypothetical protein, conserved [Eimeria necatrix]CDJ68001.1 hypothetical protein, conserved [Eimeria necatrix]
MGPGPEETSSLNQKGSKAADFGASNSSKKLQHSHLHAAPKTDFACLTDAERRDKLERRLQAQLRDGTRSRNVKRLGDPLVKHLLRVAGNAAYRDLRQSVIATGKTLVCELLSNFPCRRLAVRRRGLAALQALLPSLYSAGSPPLNEQTSNATHNAKIELPLQDARHSDYFKTRSRLNTNVETHFVSNRILRKVAGFQSYDDGCVAEMRMPDQAQDFADIRLLLCLGNIPPSLGRIDQSTASKHSAEDLDPGTVGTLLRTAAALQWQGAWILPSCPDVFNPLAIRASQGALFWLPYRRGSAEELIQLCRAKELALCVPHESGTPVRTAGLFEQEKKKGVCLVLDWSLINSSIMGSSKKEPREDSTSLPESSPVSPGTPKDASRRAKAKHSIFKPDIFLSLGAEIAPEGTMHLLHPITVASMLIYHIKHVHFPSLAGSPYLFSVKQRTKAM